ncbi:DNA repair protein RecN [Metabacillus malikii]|uniref:DNA repair protein RecN n=1 Tax=Metabacillus malikii TaxID=1504265 RepID=A0ABT9ZI11_9BACI|nr:DNA repair protein RecN [Metabacillus malikii]MDQ0231914.1 DNA repair protein RecN (Recombination protein N) [Metabacillus malikii]
MLAELSIKNFAIIESLSISFEKGLTVLTGETGAGKSIIIDAIHLLSGARGSAEFVRFGEKRAELEGLFLIEETAHPVYDKCNELGIDVSDGMIVLRRDLSSSGKSICRINGKLVTIAILREVGQYLVDIHGQHDNQELMNEENHLKLLDQYGGNKISKALEDYIEVFKRYETLRKKLTQLSENEQEMAHRLDLLQFQLDEINNANLQLNEDEQLLEEKAKISNYEKIYEALQTSYNSLHGEQRGLDWVSHAMSHLEDVGPINPTLKELSEIVSNAYYLLEDLSYQVRNELDSLEFDPERLNYVENRLNEINQLKRKYGQTVEEILMYAAKVEEELDTIQNRDSHVNKLQKELDSIMKDLVVEAKNVSILRKSSATQLIADIHKELKELYMEKTTFDVHFNNLTAHMTNHKFTVTGIDQVEFYLSTNPGEPLKPLSKTASGGELSRIMLAMKSIFSQHQGITSIIFDEVDTGVSGRVAQAIAEKIHRVSVGSQVLCITHLPQVAAMADTHLYIAKETIDGRTKTSVKALEKAEKINEIGRMIAGAQVTELSKEHAKELLELASNSKQ